MNNRDVICHVTRNDKMDAPEAFVRWINQLHDLGADPAGLRACANSRTRFASAIGEALIRAARLEAKVEERAVYGVYMGRSTTPFTSAKRTKHVDALGSPNW
jgi:hypothetical protein